MQIFLSYAHEQKAEAEPIAIALHARGHDVFFDRDDLPSGTEYNERIENAIKASDLMVFLLSPHSIASGRYTLTELEFARQRWRNPSRRLLPVMCEPTDMTTVPAYVRAVNILVPKGSAPAEVASAVDQLRGLEYALKVAAVLGLIGAASGVLSFFSFDPEGHARWDTLRMGLPFRIPAPEVGFLFGFPIGFGAWMWGQRRWWAFLIPFVIVASCYWVTVPWISQYTYGLGRGGADDPLQQQKQFGEIVKKISLSPILDDEEKKFLTKLDEVTIATNIKYQRSLVGALIGLVLAFGTMGSLATILPAFRSIFRWLVVGAVGGAVSGVVTIIVLEGGTGFSNWKAMGLTALWLSVFSSLVGYWLARGRTSVAG